MLNIDNLSPRQMIFKLDTIEWKGRKLGGVIHVLEALEAPLVDQPLSPTLYELRQLLESIRKVVQVSMSTGINHISLHARVC